MVKKNLSCGRLIAIRRKQKGLTQAELAKTVGVSASYICHLEKDTCSSPPSDDICSKLAMALGIAASEIRHLSGRAALSCGKYATRIYESNPEFVEIFARMWLDPKYRHQILTHAQLLMSQSKQDKSKTMLRLSDEE